MKTLVEFIKELEEAARRKGEGGLPVSMTDESDPTIERYEDDDFNGWIIS